MTPPPTPTSETPAIAEADFQTFSRVALRCQKMARHFGDRQNSDSTLTAKECMTLVTTLLDAGNLMAQAVTDSLPKEPAACPPTNS